MVKDREIGFSHKPLPSTYKRMDHRQTFQQSGKQDSIKHLLNILNGIFRKCQMAFSGGVCQDLNFDFTWLVGH